MQREMVPLRSRAGPEEEAANFVGTAPEGRIVCR